MKPDDPTQAPPADPSYPDPTKAPPGAKKQWLRFPFDSKKAIPFMTVGIIVILVVQGIILFTTKGVQPELPGKSPQPTIVKARPSVSPTQIIKPSYPKSYGNGKIRIGFSADWELQTGNAPPNLVFATFTHKKSDTDFVSVRAYTTLPGNNSPTKDQFYNPLSLFWKNESTSGMLYNRPETVTVAGRRAMKQEFGSGAKSQIAYYIPLDDAYTEYTLIIVGIDKSSPNYREFMGKVTSLLESAVVDKQTQGYENTNGKFAMAVARGATIKETVQSNTLSFPLDGFSMKFEKTGVKSVEEYLKNQGRCYGDLVSKPFTLDGVEGVMYENSNCTPMGSTELYILRNGILYRFSMDDHNDPQRTIISGFRFLE